MSPDLLLCERCGYEIDGLDESGACPECGRSIWSSLPERRTGLPQRRGQNDASALRAALMVLKNPVRSFNVIRIDAHAAQRQRSSTIWSASVMFACWPITASLAFLFQSLGEGWVSTNAAIGLVAGLVPLVPHAVLVHLLIGVLTRIEYEGVRFFAARRGRRSDPATADSIISYACSDWVLAAVLFVASATTLPWVSIMVPGVALLCGLLIFESLAFIGTRRCKYANHPREPGSCPRVESSP